MPNEAGGGVKTFPSEQDKLARKAIGCAVAINLNLSHVNLSSHLPVADISALPYQCAAFCGTLLTGT